MVKRVIINIADVNNNCYGGSQNEQEISKTFVINA